MKRTCDNDYLAAKRRAGGSPSGQVIDAVSCILAGTTHQGDARYKGDNSQCMAMAACAAVYSVAKHRIFESSADIDTILQSGDALYMSQKFRCPLGTTYLRTDDLPTDIRVGNFSAQISNIDHCWIANGLFPSPDLPKSQAESELVKILATNVFNPAHTDDSDSYLFTGQHYTVAFWRHNNSLYLFNSHKVGTNNNFTENGVARLFRCNSLHQLTKLLFSRRIQGGEYSINRVHVIRVTDNNNDNDLTQCSPSYASVLRRSLSSTPTLPSSVELITQTPPPALFQTRVNNNVNSLPSSIELVSDVSLATLSPSILSEYLSLNPNSIDDCDSPTTSPATLSQSILRLNSPVLVPFKDSESSRSPSILRASQFSLFNLESMSIATTTKSVKSMQSKKTNTKTVVAICDKPAVVLQNMFSELSVENIDVPETLTKKAGRPKKVKRGRKSTKTNAHLDAVKKYNAKNLNVNRKAVKNYTANRPEIHRVAVQTYSQSHPDVNRAAVQRYNKQNPEVHREAVQRYSESHPEVNRIASATYNERSRNVDEPLRSSTTLFGAMRDALLDEIRPFSLKKPSLLSPEIYKCPKCNARLFDEEKPRKQWCCGAGAYNVQTFEPLTEDFYFRPSFLSRPRAYNNLFAFSALGTTSGFVQPTGLAFIKIQGRVYHRVFDLGYTDSVNNLGLYIHDASEREQLAQGRNLDNQIVQSINAYLEEVNPYIDCFVQLSRHPSDEAFIQFQLTSRATHGNILGDQPVGNEIAAIINTDRQDYKPNCIAVWKIGDRKPHTVDIMHPLYECFQYPLLYPQGNPGWYPNKLDNNQKKLTQNKYVRCLLLSQPRFSELGRLSEEWLVDMYCRIIEERLRFLKSLQTHNSRNELRTAPLQEVEMSIVARNEIRADETIQAEGGIVAGRIYLPNSFTGGPRYMKTKYCDSIALVNRLGNPSYFLTFTCNPKWPEIQQSITSNQRNPLICARAFNLRLAELLRDLRSGRWFGKCLYLIHVIEFQKRGLPHAHICFRVEGGGPVQNIDIDKFVRADIPKESEADGKLRKIVLNNMIHGPCGPPHRTDLPCWDNEKQKCNKFFPKPETATTFSTDKGFINLRRDSSNIGKIKQLNREVIVNDTWVVPYNAALLLKYDAHINLEVSTQRTVVKYLFKYISKGQDESRVTVVPEADKDNEIETYVTKRYVGSSDAAWRTLEFDVTAREPTVKMLPVHLENQHSVFFKPGTEEESAQRATSDLLTYFNRPVGEEFDGLSYLDFYERYIVHSKRPSTKNTEILAMGNGKFVTKRQRGELVARLFWVAPNRGEQFFLRVLLKSYPCRSFADLIKLGGPNCQTFQDAAKFVGLADDEVEYERAMLEASTFFTGPRLRSFFVLLAVNGVAVASLWDNFKKQLSEDISHRLGDNADQERVHTLCLIQINRMLRKHGTSLTQHGLPEVVDDTTELGRERVEYNRDLLVNEVAEHLPNLSADQRAIFDYVANLCSDPNFRDANDTAIFVDGPAGTGKTYLLNTVTSHVRGNLQGVVLCTASSAIAAQNYTGGSTAHSMFKFPLEFVDDLSYWSITNGSQRAELISHADVIVYDEAPMAHKYLIHILDRSLRDLMKSHKIFGGKVIIFAGDFRQIPPVVPNAKTNSDILNASVKTSPLWQKIKTFSLVTSHRCHDREYSEFILNIGSNLVPTLNLVQANLKNVIDLSNIDTVNELDELVDFVFPSLEEPSECIHRAILCTRNEAVKDINNLILDKLEGEVEHFFSIDKIDNDGADELFFGSDTLNNLNPKGMPEYDLKLKIGCICMIIRNLSFTDGLVNGTKVIITGTSRLLIRVRKFNDPEDYLIPRILFKGPISTNSPFEMLRRQFPLQLCYAMTIHKSQGQTIARVGLDLRSDMFSHGQLYVALGRVTAKQNIKILMHPERIIYGKPYAKNIVISELIS